MNQKTTYKWHKTVGMWIFLSLTMMFSLHATPLKIMMLGDSITEGGGAIPDTPDTNQSTYTQGFIQNPNNIAYRGKLFDLLQADGYSIGGLNDDLDFVGSKSGGSNYGIFDMDHQAVSGYTSHQILTNIEGWLATTPADIFLLHVGTNDGAQQLPIGEDNATNQDANTTVNNVKKILNSIFTANSNAKVFVARIIEGRRAEAYSPWRTNTLNDKIEEMVNNHSKSENIKMVNMQDGAGIEYDPCGTTLGDMQPFQDINGTFYYDFHPNYKGYEKMAQKWFDELMASDWLPSLIPDTNITYGPELIQGGNNENGDINVNSWSGVGMSYNSNVGLNTYQGIVYINSNPLANNGGMYQAIATEIGKTYLLRTTLIGSNHYTDINNYTLGSSYISVEDITPTPTSTPNHISSYVTGDIPNTVEFTFTATSNSTYISLRGDTAYKYPNLSMISVKEVLTDTTPNETNNIISPTAALGTVRSSMVDNGDGTYTISNPEGNISPYAYLRVSQTGYSGDTIRDLVAGENLTVKLRVKSTTPSAYIRSTALNINTTTITSVDTWQNIEVNVTVDNPVDNRAFIAFVLPHYVTDAFLTIDMNSVEIISSL